MKPEYNHYLILYLTPNPLFQDNDVLNLQWSNSKSLIPCLVQSLYDGVVPVRLHDFEKALTGLMNAERTAEWNILGKTASLWYYLTELFHQSLGPRKGGFAEELIVKWVEYYNNENVQKCKGFKAVKVDNDNKSNSLTLGKVLTQYGISSKSKRQIDFVFESEKLGRVDFVELRMSEHTGGRTAQQSLLDKHEELLEMLNKGLKERLLAKKINEMNLVIAILFNERHELIDPKNKNSYSPGRLNSLIKYIMQRNHIWGRVDDLKSRGYRFCNSKQINELTFQNMLTNSHSVCIVSGDGKFRVVFKILMGNQFFNEYMCKDFSGIQKDWLSMIADDVWLFYVLSINEMKIAKEFGKTSVRIIYELLSSEKNSTLNKFENLYKKGRAEKLSLTEYINQLNELANQCVNEVITYAKMKNVELIVLETNEVGALHEYLRQACLAAFAVYLAEKKLDEDKVFNKCRWSEREEA